jgi:predicted CXXCH cytochrome family protein
MRPRSAFYLIFLFAFLQIMAGCDRYARYRALSIFFDGVPHPDERNKMVVPVLANNSGVKKPETSVAEAPARHRHPAAEGTDDCSFCHGATISVLLPPKNACLRCHTHLKEGRSFIHGPAASDCVVCHNVHMAETKELLRASGDLLCFICHQQETLNKGKGHEGINEKKTACLACHDPHGGKDRFFLR